MAKLTLWYPFCQSGSHISCRSAFLPQNEDDYDALCEMEARFSKCWLPCRLTTDGATLVGEFSICQESLKSGTVSVEVCRQGDWVPTGNQ